MKFTPHELAIISLVITLTSERKSRTYDFTQLKLASSVYDKIMKNLGVIEKDGEKKEAFLESEIKFNSEEKVFISKLITEFTFVVSDGNAAEGLVAKLK